MKLDRINRLAFIALVLLISAGAANAQTRVAINMTIDSTSGAGVISPDGLSITGVAASDTVTVLIEVDNTAGPEEIQSLFTTFTFDPTIVSVTGGSLNPILDEGGFGGDSLGIVAQPQQKFGEPLGNWIGLAHASTGGPSNATGPEVTTQLVFTALANGMTDITGLLGTGDDSFINGVSNTPAGATEIEFSDPIVVTVPEAGATLMAASSLSAVFAIVGIRRRSS